MLLSRKGGHILPPAQPPLPQSPHMRTLSNQTTHRPTHSHPTHHVTGCLQIIFVPIDIIMQIIMELHIFSFAHNKKLDIDICSKKLLFDFGQKVDCIVIETLLTIQFHQVFIFNLFIYVIFCLYTFDTNMHFFVKDS